MARIPTIASADGGREVSPIDTYPDLQHRCLDCGSMTWIRWSVANNRYESDNPQWTYEGDKLWGCGNPAHCVLTCGIRARPGYRILLRARRGF